MGIFTEEERKMLKEVRNKIRGYVPFTNWWIVERNLDKSAKKVLDLGCGKGKPMNFLNRHNGFTTVGIDAFKPYVEQCKREHSHDVVLLRNLLKPIPYEDKSFDVVLCLQTLEHFTKEQGLLLIKRMEILARKQVIIATDVGEFKQGFSSDGNVFQEHKYLWSVKELKELGFKIYGRSLRGWGGETGYSQKVPKPFRWLVGVFLQTVLGGIMYHKPRFAGAVVCVKDVVYVK